jgi:hypothetical protein
MLLFSRIYSLLNPVSKTIISQYKNPLKRGILEYTMTESQSRYSIVERLTSKKLDIISSKTKLTEEVEEAKYMVEKLKADLLNWEMNIKQDIERTRRENEMKIKDAEREAEDISRRKSAVEKSLNEQINAIDEALGRIEKISESAAVQSQE